MTTNFYSFLICGIFLILLSVLDVLTYKSKKGSIPSALTTSMIIILFLVGDFKSGLLAGLFGVLFTDLDLWGGLADFKIFIASAMLFNVWGVLTYSVFLCCFAILFKFIFKKLDRDAKEMPFIPIIGFTWLINTVLLLIGGGL